MLTSVTARSSKDILWSKVHTIDRLQAGQHMRQDDFYNLVIVKRWVVFSKKERKEEEEEDLWLKPH